MSATLPLEVAVFSAANALQASKLGARRVELNAPGSYKDGGLTPPVDEFIAASSSIDIPIRIMIRPVPAPADGPDFIYTSDQFEAMKKSIVAFKNSGSINPIRGDGFVFGILRHAPRTDVPASGDQEEQPNADFSVDVQRCSELVKLASPLPCVFHRAFDPIASSNVCDIGLEDLAKCGFDGLLTSGGPGSHASHLKTLDDMARIIKAHGELGRLQLVVGGGVRASNADQAVARLGTHKGGSVWVHSACLVSDPDHQGDNVDPEALVDLVACLELARPD